MTEITTLEEKAVELIEKFEQLAVDIAPQALDLGLAAARIAAASHLIAGVAAIAVAIVAAVLSRKFWSACEAYEAKSYSDETGTLYGAGGIAFFVGALVASGVAVAKLADIWVWAGIFYPELWIAKQVLGW